MEIDDDEQNSLICLCNPNPNIEFRELEEMEEYVLNGIAEWFPVCGVDATITATSFRYPRRQLSLLGVFFFFFYVFLLLKISFWYLIANGVVFNMLHHLTIHL